MARKRSKAKKRKAAPKTSESTVEMDGDLKVTPAGALDIPEVEVDVESREVGEGAPRRFGEPEMSDKVSAPKAEKKAPTKKAKIAAVAIGTEVNLKNKAGFSVNATVIAVDIADRMVTFRVKGSDARVRKLEAEVLADLTRSGQRRTVNMEF